MIKPDREAIETAYRAEVMSSVKLHRSTASATYPLTSGQRKKGGRKTYPQK